MSSLWHHFFIIWFFSQLAVLYREPHSFKTNDEEVFGINRRAVVSELLRLPWIVTFKASSKELSLFIFKCSKLICRAIQMGFLPSLKLTLKSLKFRLCLPYKNRKVVISCASPLYDFIDLFILNNWEKRCALQRARGLQLMHNHRVHNTSSTQLSGVWGDSNLLIFCFSQAG